MAYSRGTLKILLHALQVAARTWQRPELFSTKHVRSVSPWGALNPTTLCDITACVPCAGPRAVQQRARARRQPLGRPKPSLINQLYLAQGPELFSNERVRGGSPWGAGTFAGGDGSRQPSELELDFAKYQARSAAPALGTAVRMSAHIRSRISASFHLFPHSNTQYEVLNFTMSAHTWFAGHVFHAQHAHRRAMAKQVAGTIVHETASLL